ncbi:MAG: glycosyltransferase [Candidatus Thermoplasmatota archaeon]|jgi:glycosyltransferase involved in cell wall biosynthesis|nr:glycosyltransferase [Candidatus Thermoplasmatota archaeon]MCL5789176.1 glycosyltransferase [Candidatus Thermoplasmatota archaeon]
MENDTNDEKPLISVVIPFKKATPFLYDCINALLNQNVREIEVICIPDAQEKIEIQDARITVAIKPGTPSAKRNYGVSIAKSGNIAFIDDDAIPSPNWLELGLRDLEKEPVIGGPNIAPANENVRRIASDLFLTSVYGSLREVYRYKPVTNKKYVDDLLTVNMFVKKGVFVEMGGFDLDLWPGEDTHLSEELKKAGYNIYYDPYLFVYHHRREVFRSHLSQMWRYAKYRGAAIKIGEFKPFYLISSFALILAPILIVLSILVSSLIAIFTFGLIPLLSIIIFVDYYKRCKSLEGSFLGMLTVWFSHITYGAGVLYGIFFTNVSTATKSI